MKKELYRLVMGRTIAGYMFVDSINELYTRLPHYKEPGGHVLYEHIATYDDYLGVYVGKITN